MNATCAPLFLGSILADGHGVQTASATATFVKFRNRNYVVTCRHVKKIAFSQAGWTARLHAHPAIIELAHWTSAGRQPTLNDVGSDASIDISLCPLPEHLMEMLAKNKPKAPIDLDRFSPPNWREITHCLAAGFPDRAKSEDGTSLASPLIEVVAEIASTVDARSTSLVMQSQLQRPPGWGFSGMSGGPIFALDESDQPSPVGIIFEGYPSGEEGPRSEDAFLRDNDVLIRGHLLTPDIFTAWLQAANL